MSVAWAVIAILGVIIVGFLGAAGLQASLGALLARKGRAPQAPKLTGSPGGALHDEMKALAHPTLLLLPADRPAFSKLGGAPDLEDRATWPTSTVTHRFPKREVTTPMGFVAQLDLGEVRAAGGPDWLYDQGRLFFFAEPWMGAALYVANPDETCRAITVPVLPRGFPLPERRVAMTLATSYPDLEWLVEDIGELDIDGDALDRLAEFPAAHMPIPEHRVGGHASAIQSSDMELECEQMLAAQEGRKPAATRARDTDWRLLLQVDTDADLKTNWGDGGRLYYWVREADARAGDFSKIRMVGQSH